ncbi:MAG TPA: hypothetical protein PKA27_16615, partial [Fimbriimonadaceae bacterium]|nr:hypothetical protein [Fimbriimonadaceae bacterium]
DAAGTSFGVVELEDCGMTKLDKEMRQELLTKGTTVRGYDPYRHVEQAIKHGSKQFRGVQANLPCLLVVADILRKPSDARAVVGAMVGAVSIQIPLSGDGTAEPKSVFGKGGKMTDPPEAENGLLSLQENRRIGAVAYLKVKPVRAILAGLFADRKAIYEYYGDRLGDAVEASAKSDREYAARGISESDVEPCLEIYINPLSSLPWPLAMHGPYDQVQRPQPRNPHV